VTPVPTQLDRARAIDHALDAVKKTQAEAKIAFGLRYKGPFGNEREDLTSLVFGAPVRVYREGTKKWEGPFKFVSVDGNTACVELPSGRKIFRSVAKCDFARNRKGRPSPDPLDPLILVFCSIRAMW
jgi:hypothetical protein